MRRVDQIQIYIADILCMYTVLTRGLDVFQVREIERYLDQRYVKYIKTFHLNSFVLNRSGQYKGTIENWTSMGWKHVKVALLYLFCISVFVYIYYHINFYAYLMQNSLKEREKDEKHKISLGSQFFNIRQSTGKTDAWDKKRVPMTTWIVEIGNPSLSASCTIMTFSYTRGNTTNVYKARIKSFRCCYLSRRSKICEYIQICGSREVGDIFNWTRNTDFKCFVHIWN